MSLVVFLGTYYLNKRRDNEIMILKIVETIFLVSMTSSLEKEYLKVMVNKMVLSDTHCDIKSKVLIFFLWLEKAL